MIKCIGKKMHMCKCVHFNSIARLNALYAYYDLILMTTSSILFLSFLRKQECQLYAFSLLVNGS